VGAVRRRGKGEGRREHDNDRISKLISSSRFPRTRSAGRTSFFCVRVGRIKYYAFRDVLTYLFRFFFYKQYWTVSLWRMRRFDNDDDDDDNNNKITVLFQF